MLVTIVFLVGTVDMVYPCLSGIIYQSSLFDDGCLGLVKGLWISMPYAIIPLKSVGRFWCFRIREASSD
jgi:hypothetical protein